MSKKGTLDILDKCMKGIEDLTPEQIEAAKKDFDAMPSDGHFILPAGFEPLIPHLDKYGRIYYTNNL